MGEDNKEIKSIAGDATNSETKPRDYVMRLYRKSLIVYDALYKRLSQ